MFEIKNRKISDVNNELVTLKEKERKLENLIEELPWIASGADDLEKELCNIDKRMRELKEEKYKKRNKLEQLKSKLSQYDILKLQEELNKLKDKVEQKEKEKQRNIDDEFKKIMTKMNEKNTMTKYISSNTATTPIMDEFNNDEKKIFLVLRGIFKDKDLVIVKKPQNVTIDNTEAPTMTELKNYRPNRTPSRMVKLVKTLSEYDSVNLKKNQKIQFEKPIPLGGQTYANQTGYGWEWSGYGSYIEGTYYGEVTIFLIVGFIRKR